MHRLVTVAALGLGLGLGLAVPAPAAQISSAGLVEFEMGRWDPFRTCTIPAGEDFIGDIDVSVSGTFFVEARVVSYGRPHRMQRTGLGQVAIANNSNSECTIDGIRFDAVGVVNLTFAAPFEIVPFMEGSASAWISGPAPFGNHGVWDRYLTTADQTPPWDDREDYDSYDGLDSVTLAAGESAVWNTEVRAYAFSSIPLPPAALLAGSALAGLAAMRRRR